MEEFKSLVSDGYLRNALRKAKEVVKKDWDMVFVVDGYEGSGKSVIAQQCAYECDPTLDISRIVFTPEEFRTAVINSKPYQAIIYDEGFTGLSSRNTMTPVNKALVAMMAEIRQKNLFIFVVMPTFYDLDRYVALWRSRGLIHVYTGDDFERGFFAFYNIDDKKALYVNGKKIYSYSWKTWRPSFIGRFTSKYAIDEAVYRAKKLKSLSDRESYNKEDEEAKRVDELLIERVLALPDTIPHTIKMDILKIPSSTYFVKLRKFRENNLLEVL